MSNIQKTSSKEKLLEVAVIHLQKEGLNNFTATALNTSLTQS